MKTAAEFEQKSFIGAYNCQSATMAEPLSNISYSYSSPRLISQNYKYNSCSMYNSSNIPASQTFNIETPMQYKIPWQNSQNFFFNQHSSIQPMINYNTNFNSVKFPKKPKQRHFALKVKFTPEEDELLLSLVQEHGSKDWIKISRLMNGTRNPRQCRERYKNYINPELRKDNWTKEEDDLLVQKYSEFGGKWNKIAKFFVNRSDNHLRNRWMMIARHRAKGDTDFFERSSTSTETQSKESAQSSPDENLKSSDEEQNNSFQTKQTNSNQQTGNHEVEELSSTNLWLNDSAFNLFEFQNNNNGFNIFGNDQSELWPF